MGSQEYVAETTIQVRLEITDDGQAAHPVQCLRGMQHGKEELTLLLGKIELLQIFRGSIRFDGKIGDQPEWKGRCPGRRLFSGGFPLRQTHCVDMEFHDWRLDLAGDLT